jgi:hypothetical protein
MESTLSLTWYNDIRYCLLISERIPLLYPLLAVPLAVLLASVQAVWRLDGLLNLEPPAFSCLNVFDRG